MEPKRRVLIVDDEPNIILSLEFLLRQQGYEVSVARDGEEALVAAEDWRPDLMVLDVMLPGLDGFEVCRRLRERPENAGLKILLLTARGREVERVRGLEEGADAYVRKPFSTRQLMKTVAELLGRPEA
ncbi:MAG TPA: response regulator [Thermoanaerobaculia bacterium]|jgi:DNA-binding response OmpR family regulator|nr:response regulator [Thermoanaerobaculia bacterium]